MVKTRGGFLISQIKQIQGRVFGKLLAEAGIDEFNGAQGRILYVLWQEDNLPIVELSRRTKVWGISKDVMIPKTAGRFAFVSRTTRAVWNTNTRKSPMK